MMKNNYSRKLIDVIEYSREEAARLRNSCIGPEHLMLGVLRDGDCQAIRLMEELDVNAGALKKAIESEIRNTSEEEKHVPLNEILIGKTADRVLR
ncbi:MAG: Clp protease N-terminal domain-containing protein, partial [Tannerella sp.]|nr:Clp protease N-terminal domain-containing protein [Tannerella sp.]